MKKILVVLLIVGFVFSCSNAFAFLDRLNQDQKVKVAVFSNPYTSTGTRQIFKQYVSDSNAGILVPGVHRILGYTVVPIPGATYASYESWVAMYDSTSIEQTNLNKLEAEIETTASTGNNFWYPYPYEIKEGVVLYIGPNCAATVYYEDYRR